MDKKMYKVRVVETLERVVLVAASNKQDAIKSIEEAYRREMIVLDYHDYKDTNINGRIVSPQEYKRLAEETNIEELTQAEIWR